MRMVFSITKNYQCLSEKNYQTYTKISIPLKYVNTRKYYEGSKRMEFSVGVGVTKQVG